MTITATTLPAPAGRTRIEFASNETFGAGYAAERWCDEHGVSYGPSDRYNKICLMHGKWQISKWHNLTAKQRRQCHGTITGDGRNGPVILDLKNLV
jgi:hypothetical protein